VRKAVDPSERVTPNRCHPVHPGDDRYVYSEEYLRGAHGPFGEWRGPKREIFGVVTTGSERDLEKPNLARGMSVGGVCPTASAGVGAARRVTRTWQGYPTQCSASWTVGRRITRVATEARNLLRDTETS